ncbi:MAG TPA: polysaccharide biosynthesis tyrosine autokinase [Candidatus Acidoferrales bacterium]|nr:polysaccharide biosynthesis tyrosine autokinase [Candidatus Acidoferrales bacterium]
MEVPEFPIEKASQSQTELSAQPERRPAVCKYLDASEVGAPPAQNYDSLLDYWQILFRHRFTLLSFAIASLCAALLITLVQTPIYRVRTSLEIQSGDFGELRDVDSGSPPVTYSSPETYVETQVKLLQSESLIEDVINKMKLHKNPPSGLWGTFASLVHRAFAFSRSVRLPEDEQMLRQVQRNLTVQSSGDSRLLEILYESPDPKLAADFANTLVGEFIELNQEERWKAAQSTAEWLTNHLNQMKTQLETSEEQLQDYAQTAGLSYTSDKESVADDRLKEIQDELSKAQADRIDSEAKYEEAQDKPADSLPEILGDPTMRDERQKLSDLQRQYAELSATLTPAHYKVRQVQAQIDVLQTQIRKQRANVLGRIRNEYAAAERRERLLSDDRDNQEKVVAEQSSKAIHYDTLKRDVESNRHLYELMLQKVKEASLAAAMRDSNVIVIDRAKPPLLPYRPSLLMNSAIGLFSGVFLGIGFVLLRERFDRRISAPGEAQIFLDLPELGVIPLDEAVLPLHHTSHLHLLRSAPALLSARSTTSSPNNCPELATWKRKPSLIAECTRTTLTSILLPNQNGEGPQVVVLTSPCLGDGKTTVACNLSIAIAEIGRRVLLIDGDLRRPRLQKVFGLSNDWGLCDVLCSDSQLDTIPIAHLILESEVRGLSLLPGGSCGLTPTNLFYSRRMSSLLSRVRREFDMILIDAPPMIHLADARVLGRLADGVILVVRAGQTTAESARFAIRRFAEDGTHVLGTVLNSWDPRTTSRYGYGGYGSYKSYAAPSNGSH